MQSRRCRRRSAGTLIAFFYLFFLSVRAQAQVSVTTQHVDNARSGQNTQETILTPANVNSTSFGKLFSVPVDGYLYAQPLYLANVNISNVIHNVVFVATEHDSVYAIDADVGTVLWRVSFINPAAGITTVTSSDVGCGDLIPEIGITSTPVIDSANGTIFVVAKTKENGAYKQRLHALDIKTGVERPGSPVEITATVSGTGDGSVGGILSFDARRQLNRPGLLLQDGHVIIGWASHCDISPYHGWIISYNSNSLSQEAVFNTTPSGGLGGVWQGGGGLAADSNSNVYFATGNGTYDGNPNLGDSVVKLGPQIGSSFPLSNWFTPYDQNNLNDQDADLGSGGVVLLPDQPVGSPHQHLLAMAGKSGTIYLIDRDSMGHFQSGSNSQIVQSIAGALPGMWGLPAWWNNRLYAIGTGDSGGASGALKAYAFNPATGLFSTSVTSQSTVTFTFPGPTPAISANGTGSAIAWVIQVNQFNGSAQAVLRAFDANNLSTQLYYSQQNATRDNPGPAVKFTVPTVVSGKVYVGTQTQLSVFGLFSPFVGLSLNPGTVLGSNSSTGSVLLNAPAPAGGITINLSSGNPAVATVPGTVTVPAGTMTATFPISTSLVSAPTAVSISGSYSGTTQSSVLTVKPWLSSLVLNPSSLAGGSNSIGTVNLSAPAPAEGIIVQLSSSDLSAAVPAEVTIAPAASTANFPISTSGVTVATAVTITATYNGFVTANLSINPAATGITSLTLNPTSVAGGIANSVGTITLNGSAPVGGAPVTLSSNNAAATAPSMIVVPAGASSTTFTISTSAVSAVISATITATFNNSTVAALTVNPAPSFNAIRVNSGGPAYTDSLGQAWSADTGFSGGSTFNVSASAAIANTSDPTLYRTERWGTFSYSFSVPAGNYSVTLKFCETSFTAAGKRVFGVNINGTSVLSNFDVFAQAGGASRAVDRTFTVATTGGITIQFVAGSADLPNIDALQIVSYGGPSVSMQLNPTTLTGGSISTATVTLAGAAPAGGALVALASSDPSVATVPANVTVAAGATTATFQVTGNLVSALGTTTISATYNGTTTAQLTVRPLIIQSVTLNPAAVIGGTTPTVGTVTFNGPAPPGGISVSLSSNNTITATVPDTTIVPANAISANFAVTSFAVSAKTDVEITASTISSGSAMGMLTVNAPSVLTLTLNPSNVIGGSPSNATVTLDSPAPQILRGILVSLSSNNPAATVPTNVAVQAGETTATFPVTTQAVASQVNAMLTATLNGSANATLSVNPSATGITSVSLSPSSLVGGAANSTGTVTLNGAAGAGGTVVTLSSNNPEAASVPATVTVPQGATTATFTVSTFAVSSTAAPMITADFNGSVNATLTVNPRFISSLSLAPSVVVGGAANSTGTVTLNGAAGVGGAVVTLSSNILAAASVPATVTVPQGATTATFTVSTFAVGSTATPMITAEFNGSANATLTVNPRIIASLSLTPNSVTGGLANSTGTVTLNGPAPFGGVVVTLTSGNPATANIPESVAVAAGMTAATFTVTSTTVLVQTPVTITGALNGASQSATLAVNPVPVVSPVAFIRAVGNSGQSVRYTVNIAPAAGNFLAVFVWQIEAATTPSAMTDNLGSVYTRDCDLTYNPGNGVRRLTVYHLANAPGGITGINITPNKPSRGIVAEYSGMPATGVVLDVCGAVNNQTTASTTWSSAATTTTATDLIFGLTDTGKSGNAGFGASGAWTPRLAQHDPVDVDDSFFDDQINVVAGTYTATGTSTVSLVKSSVAVAYKITQAPPALASLTVNPSTIVGGNPATATVTLTSAAPAAGAEVTLLSDNPAASVPVSVTVAAGLTTATFSVSTVSVASSTPVAVSGTYVATKQTTLTVIPPVALALSSVALNPSAVTGGSPSTGTVTLNASVPAEGVSIPLVSDNPSVATVPQSVTVAGGAATATFAVTTVSVVSSTQVTISGTYNSTKSSILTVNPTVAFTVASVTLAPTTVLGGASSTGTVTLSGTVPAGGSVAVALSDNSTAASVPPSVTVLAGAKTATFAVATIPVAASTSVIVTAAIGASSKTATLTVSPPALSSVSVSPNSVIGGNSTTGTATLSGAAPTGGTVVTLSDNNAAASEAISVTIPAGATSATFSITTIPVAANTSVTISGTLNGTTRNATLTVNRPAISTVSVSPSSVKGGTSSTGTVTLTGAAPTAGTVVTLSDNNAAAAEPSSVTVAAGATTATFTITTTTVTSSRTVTISGALNGTTKTATLTITP